ncbi:hypothetical protein ALO78_200130 [Pseudomonas amygdali pv. ciccaronei]|nr:hypothetical protein ALO78_200130 [Pseudomonas amygdali pv. ciccaronei]
MNGIKRYRWLLQRVTGIVQQHLLRRVLHLHIDLVLSNQLDGFCLEFVTAGQFDAPPVELCCREQRSYYLLIFLTCALDHLQARPTVNESRLGIELVEHRIVTLNLAADAGQQSVFVDVAGLQLWLVGTYRSPYEDSIRYNRRAGLACCGETTRQGP